MLKASPFKKPPARYSIGHCPSPSQPSCMPKPRWCHRLPSPARCLGLPAGRCTAPGSGPARDPAGPRGLGISSLRAPGAFRRAFPTRKRNRRCKRVFPRPALSEKVSGGSRPLRLPPAEPYLGCKCTCSRPAGWRQSRPCCRRRGALPGSAAGERCCRCHRPARPGPAQPGPALRARFLPQAPPLARRRQKEVGPWRQEGSAGSSSPPLLSPPPSSRPLRSLPRREARGCSSPVSETWEQKVAGGSSRSCRDGERVHLQASGVCL